MLSYAHEQMHEKHTHIKWQQEMAQVLD